MKISRIEDGDYHLVYFFLPQKEGRPKRISKRIPKSEPNAKAKAEKLRTAWKRQIDMVGTSGILPPKIFKDFLAAKGVLIDHKVSLYDVANFYVQHNDANQKSENIEQAVEVYLETERGRGLNKVTYRQYVTRCRRFGEGLKGTPVSSLTGEDIINWLLNLKLSPITAWAYLGCIERVLNDCTSRQLIKESPLTPGLLKKMPLKRRESSPPILTGEQGVKLFQAFPLEEKAMFAVQYFTGMRRTIGQKITWGHVDFETRVISIPDKADKKFKDRFIEGMAPRMWEILEQLPPRPKGENIIPSDTRYKRLMQKAIDRAGIDPWPRNALRRSFASHFLNYENPDGSKDRLTDTLLIMMHQQNPATFWKHYFRRSRPSWANAYFNVSLTAAEKKSLGIR